MHVDNTISGFDCYYVDHSRNVWDADAKICTYSGVVSFFGLLAYFILIPRFGVYGAAAGYVISEIVEIIVVFSFLRGEKVKGSISLHIHSENSL